MKFRSRSLRLAVLVVVCAVLCIQLPLFKGSNAQTVTAAATHSSPIVLDRADEFVWAVNPDNDTVSVVDVRNDANTKVAEIAVGQEPQSIAIANDNTKAYVANAVSGTVSVISTATHQVIKTVPVGTEPWAVCLTPNGTKLYVANSSSNSLSVIDTATDTVARTIHRVALQPRGLAVTNDGDSDDHNEKLYVTSFLAQYRPGEVRPGEDTGKVGLVSVVSTQNDQLLATIQLQPIADTGFKSNGSALLKKPPINPAPPENLFVTGAFPNILASLTIKNNRVYVPATGSSPNGPDTFNVNVQCLVPIIETSSDTDSGKTLNLNHGIQNESDADDAQGRPLKRFVTNPYFIAFRHQSDSGYIVSAASDMAVKMDLKADGTPTINAPTAAGQTSNVKRVLAGKNPRAMVINAEDTRGYIWNYVSRDVTVVDLTNDTAMGTFVLANQPTDALQLRVQRGKEFFNSSIGPVVPHNGVNEGLLSNHGWVSCASCHPNGLTDGVVWLFGAGPRFSTPLNSTFSKGPEVIQRALNWSAFFDEVADFELNTRNTAGGQGLILLPGTTTPDPNVKRFDPPSAGRSGDRDAITDYFQHGIRGPISPIPDNDIRALEGRRIFQQAGCLTCHGGPLWTSSKIDYTPPPAPGEVVNNQLVRQLKQVGTFNAADPFEVTNLGAPALGVLGFNPPSLLGIFTFGPYLHNGTALDLEQVLDNPVHVGSSPLLSVPTKRKQLIRFLQSIDDSTPPFPAP